MDERSYCSLKLRTRGRNGRSLVVPSARPIPVQGKYARGINRERCECHRRKRDPAKPAYIVCRAVVHRITAALGLGAICRCASHCGAPFGFDLLNAAFESMAHSFGGPTTGCTATAGLTQDASSWRQARGRAENSRRTMRIIGRS